MKFSIIICTFNSAERISQVLTAITNLQLGPSVDEIELIVVNNSSTDSTHEIVTEFFKTNRPSFPFKLVNEPLKGLVYARLKGLREAAHPWVLFCDDDNLLAPDYLVQAASVISQDSDIGALGGIGIPMVSEPLPAWFEKGKSSYAVGPQSIKSGPLASGRHLYGAGLLLKKSLLDRVFSAGIQPIITGRVGKVLTGGDDLELCFLVSLADGQLWYEEKMKFFHVIPSTRLELDHYHRLVFGHASSEGIIFMYQRFLENRNLSDLGFELTYLRKVFLCGAVYMKYSIIEKLRGGKSFGYQLNKNRFFSFLENRKQAKEQFTKIRRAFPAV